jgi:hypothetical protein
MKITIPAQYIYQCDICRNRLTDVDDHHNYVSFGNSIGRWNYDLCNLCLDSVRLHLNTRSSVGA